MENKFRAKTTYDSSWVEGFLVENTIVTDCDYDGVWIHINKFCSINPDTIGQHIGIEDDKGIPIYEGDIVKIGFMESDRGEDDYEGEDIVEVKYNKNVCGYIPFVWYSCCENCETSFTVTSVEVIGNIYDNAELLK